MFRRLNYLLPNAKLAQRVVNELHILGVNDNYIHAYTKNKLPTGSLNCATHNQETDEAQKIENIFWNGNLVLFFIFLSLFIIAISASEYILALLSVGVMLLSFSAGSFFAKHIPKTHFDNFKQAISHNELLLMVDIPDEKVGFIENTIHRHHPALIDGGSSWMLKGVDI